MNKKDYYDVLEIDKNADQSTIKKAYRLAAMKHHPDKNPGDSAAEEKFKEAAEAYEILKDSNKRSKYDQFGHDAPNMSSGFNMNDIFSHFGDIFSGFGNQSSGQQRHKQQRGSDIQLKLNLSFEEALYGVEKKIKIKKMMSCDACSGSGSKDGKTETCSTCNGSGIEIKIQTTFLGHIQSQYVCSSCSGSGKSIKNKCKKCNGESLIKKEETVILNIPSGVATGMQLNKKGDGNHAKFGGTSGNLIVVINVAADKKFNRVMNDVSCDLNISFIDAVFGSTKKINLFGDFIDIMIPKGSQTGTIFTIKDKGFNDLNRGNKGSLLIKINILTPTSLTKNEEKHLRELYLSKNFVV